MNSTTRLHSATFQLTPTRTRCDLFINANEKKEKIASGLLNPFLAHLKTAQDQIVKGGYSILLQPEPGSDATWFTKGTVERFVRFVSTPEILERVYTTESEIVQIEEAIAVQGNNDIGLNTIENHQVKPGMSNEGNKHIQDANEEKAIVLYKPDTHPPEADGSIAQEGNSKVELLKVLETRKTVLQKEQGMAFARAVAAGFDIDHMAPLVSFAECFGASRLMDACIRFMDLWKRKHETGQWIEIEAAEAMSSKLDFSAMNASGIMLSSVANKQNESQSVASENNAQAGVDTSTDGRPPVDHQTPIGQQEYFPGQYPHSMFPPWPMHSPPGALPAFQAYPMQGMPYYQNYSGNVPFYPPPYPPMEDSQFSFGHRTGSEMSGMDGMDLEREASLSRDSVKKIKKSAKKQSGTVVIRNINFITSKRQTSSGSESESASDSETDAPNMVSKNNMRSSKRKESQAKSADETNSQDKEEAINEKETYGEHWQAFQSCLLRDADEDNCTTKEGMFEMEKDVQMKKRQNMAGDDPLVSDGRETQSNLNGTDDIQFAEINGRKIVCGTANDDFIIGGRENQSNLIRSSTDPLAGNEFEGPTNNFDRISSHDMPDESFIVPFRSLSLDQDGTDDRTAIDMNYELPSPCQNSDSISNRIASQVNYEPDGLSLMPERESEKRSTGYDPALDYEMQFCAKDAASPDKRSEEVSTDEQSSKVIPDTVDKKKTGGPMRKGKPSKMSPLEEARARAEKLRTYKADLQKMKKEKEEEEKKRLEALKIARQKRIAAKGGPTSAVSPLPSPQTRKQLPTKNSPISHKGSKFTDSEPGSLSPLQRSKIRTVSLGSSDSKKVSKISKSSDVSHLTGNRLNRSMSSLSDHGVTPDSKASMARIRRLSEPKSINSLPATSVKKMNTEPVSKPKISGGPESKKISAIINLDRSKAATLPELKIKTPKETSNLGQSRTAAKEMTQKVNRGKPSVTSENAELIMDDVDDNLVIEKTVVMLESEKPCVPSVHASEEKTGLRKEDSDNFDLGEKNESVSEYVAIRAPPSPIDGVEKEPILRPFQDQPSSYKVTTSHMEKESPKFSGIGIAEEPYQAPFARVSSIEDPCTRNSEYGKAPQSGLETLPTSAESAKGNVSDFINQKLEKIPEALEKPQVKESSKGFRRLLKLGRKNHSGSTAGEQSVESDNAIGNNGSELDDGAAISASSSEVYTLKNLISQDETPTAGNSSQKSSRHFSLFSPFRSKTSEKKLII